MRPQADQAPLLHGQVSPCSRELYRSQPFSLSHFRIDPRIGIGRRRIELDHPALRPFPIPRTAVEFGVGPCGNRVDQPDLGLSQACQQTDPIQSLMIPVELLGQETEFIPFEPGLGKIDRLTPVVSIQPLQNQLIPPDQIRNQIGSAHRGPRRVTHE